jgi:pimeloyl-ACP methyl ester carboxylesterase
MMNYLNVEGNKKIAFEVIQPEVEYNGRVLVCIPGLGDLRSECKYILRKASERVSNHVSTDRYLAAILAQKGYKLILLDHRGLGDSDTEFSAYGPEDCGNDVIKVIDAYTTSEEKVFVLGNSFGGASAIWATAERIRSIQGIVLIDAFVRDHPFPFGMATLLRILCNDWIGPSFWTSYYQSLYTIQPSPVKDLPEYCNRLRTNLQEPKRMKATKKQIFASKSLCTQRMTELQTQHVPALILFGEKDPDFLKEVNGCENEAKWIQSHLDSNCAQYAIIPQAGHYPHVEAAEEVSQMIHEFVEKLI